MKTAHPLHALTRYDKETATEKEGGEPRDSLCLSPRYLHLLMVPETTGN